MLNDNDLIDKGLKQKLIKITNNNRITYTHQKKEYNFQDPEERVRAITFLDLIINYKYPVEFIDVEFSIQRGSKKKLRLVMLLYLTVKNLIKIIFI